MALLGTKRLSAEVGPINFLSGITERKKIVICLIIFTLMMKQSDAISQTACENFQMTMTCHNGVLKINDAFYGRTDTSKCPRVGEFTTTCYSRNSTLIIARRRCEQRARCQIFAHNSVFGDPCPLVTKYLIINHICVELSCDNFGERCSDNEMCVNMGNRVKCICKDTFMEDENGVCKETVLRTIEEIKQVNVTNENAAFLTMSVLKASDFRNITDEEILKFVVDIFESIVELGISSDEITTGLVAITSGLMNINPDLLKKVPEVGRIPLLLELYSMNIQEESRNVTKALNNVAMSANVISSDALLQRVTFRDILSKVTSNSTIYTVPTDVENGLTIGDSLDANVTSSITLPASIGSKLLEDRGNISVIPLSFLIFKDDTLFPMTSDTVDPQGGGGNFTIQSHVISASVDYANVTIDDLPETDPVFVRFKLFLDENITLNEVERRCVFWRYNEVTRLGEWASDGCHDVTKSTDSHVTCSCTHLTSFAVLIRVKEDSTPSPFAIDVISDVGCIISILGLTVCILTCLLIKTTRSKQLTQIHIHLSLSLVALYVTFFVGVEFTDNPMICKIVATLIHLFCLLSMGWMSVEAFNMFMLLWLVKRNKIKHLVPFGMIFTWGMSLSVAITVAFFDTHDFAKSEDYCFLHPGYPMYFGFLLPMFLLLSFNAVVFILITYRVSCRDIIVSNSSARRKAEMAKIKGPILFWILLGMSWLFGFLSAATSSTVLGVVFSSVFSVMLALQGVFMFYVLTVNNPEISETFGRFKTFVVKPYTTHVTVKSSNMGSQDTNKNYTTSRDTNTNVPMPHGMDRTGAKVLT